MDRKHRITTLINDLEGVESVKVTNNSHLHSGHLGDDGTGETHFALEIKSSRLKNMSRVAAQREVNQALQEEFDGGLHALEIKVV